MHRWILLAILLIGCIDNQTTIHQEVSRTHSPCGHGSPFGGVGLAAPTIPIPPNEPSLAFETENVLVLYMHAKHSNSPLPDCPPWPEPQTEECYEPPDHVPTGVFPDVPDFIEDLALASEQAYQHYAARGFLVRPARDGKVIVDTTRTWLGTDGSHPALGVEYPGDLVLIHPQPLWVSHSQRQVVLRATAFHEMFHTAQDHAYHSGSWPRDGSGWFDPVFEPMKRNMWLVEATAAHMNSVNWPTRAIRQYSDELMYFSGLSSTSYGAFPVFGFLERNQPALDIVRRFHAGSAPWFHWTMPNTELGDRLLYDRLAQLVPDPANRRAMWIDFAYAYQYSHDPMMIPRMNDWGPSQKTQNVRPLSGYERYTPAVGEQPPLLAATTLDHSTYPIGPPGRIASWAFGVKQALCVGAPNCNGGSAIPDPADYQLVLEVPVPEHVHVRVSRAPNAHGNIYPASPIVLAQFAGPRAANDPVIIELETLAENDHIVVTLLHDSEAPITNPLFLTQIRAFFQSPAAEIVFSGSDLLTRRRDGRIYCRGENLDGVCRSAPGAVLAPVPIVDAKGTSIIASKIYFGPGRTACAVRDDDQVWCWGSNALGLLGNGTTTPAPLAPTLDHMYQGADDAALSWMHGCVVRDGQVRCAGLNGEGQLGNATQTNSTLPVLAPIGGTAVRVATHLFGSCALDAAGGAWCWGKNGFSTLPNDGGALGTGSTQPYVTVPQPVLSVTGATQLHAAGRYGVRIADGRAMTWGSRIAADRGCGTSTTFAPAPCFVRDSIAPLQDVIEIQDRCARKADGTVWCWGTNQDGALGLGIPYTSCPPPPQCGHPSVGYMPPGNCQPACFSVFARRVPSLGGVTDLSSSSISNCALMRGATYCWGRLDKLFGSNNDYVSVPTPIRVD